MSWLPSFLKPRIERLEAEVRALRQRVSEFVTMEGEVAALKERVTAGEQAEHTRAERERIESPAVMQSPIEEGTAQVINGYALGSEIGRGVCGVVYRAVNMNTGRVVAFKRINFTRTTRPESVEQEINVLMRLRANPHVVRLEEFIVGDKSAYLVFELAHGPVMHMTSNRQPHLQEGFVILVMRQVVLALEFLHANGILHQDLKPDNVLLFSGTQVRICDFGISIAVPPDGEFVGDVRSTLPFRAPEMFIPKGGASTASDIWAAGVTAFCLLTGELPFRGISHAAIKHDILEAQPTYPHHVTAGARAFVEEILVCDPEVRPSTEALRISQFLTHAGSVRFPDVSAVEEDRVVLLSNLESPKMTRRRTGSRQSLSSGGEMCMPQDVRVARLGRNPNPGMCATIESIT